MRPAARPAPCRAVATAAAAAPPPPLCRNAHSTRRVRRPTDDRNRRLRRAATVADDGERRTSLVPEVLRQLRADPEHQALIARVQAGGQAAMTAAERALRRRSLDALGVPSFAEFVADRGLPPLTRGVVRTLQLNIGLACNQACTHCHVESSPLRTERMDERTAERCVELLHDAAPRGLATLDLTGGAPELNKTVFRRLVASGREAGLTVIDRCNLTILLEPGQEDLVAFLAEHKVRIVASLPCYSEANVDAQRGRGVFERSVRGLQLLNAVGYGMPGTGLVLDLVYNPGGAFLAPDQATLEPAYKAELRDAHGVEFNRLLALNNMPIKRFADWLVRQGKLTEYMELLVNAFNPASLPGVMCADTLSVGWDGRLFDCDFNGQLDIGVAGGALGRTVFDIGSLAELEGRPVAVGSHCFGCTAGFGSGCQGATAG